MGLTDEETQAGSQWTITDIRNKVFHDNFDFQRKCFKVFKHRTTP